MVEQLITYIVNAIIYLMHLLYANLYFIPFVGLYILFNALPCFNMDLESAINVYTIYIQYKIFSLFDCAISYIA